MFYVRSFDTWTDMQTWGNVIGGETVMSCRRSRGETWEDPFVQISLVICLWLLLWVYREGIF